jgi:LuxR family quorum sensing-dependent transcriptional regulator
MLHPVADAARIARGLGSAASQGEVWRQLKTFAALYGFHHLTVLKRKDSLPRAVAPSVVYIDAPEGFAEAFDRLQLGLSNPLVTRALASTEPFSAADTYATPLNEEQRCVLRHLSVSLNLRDGWTFPIAYCGETRGIVIIAGLAPDMSPLAASMLHLLSHTAFRRSEELAKSGPRTTTLSTRELECLRWVAQGKTDVEIAVILGIKARTVRFHVENAKRKLQVATRVQAVAQALRLQAIAA